MCALWCCTGAYAIYEAQQLEVARELGRRLAISDTVYQRKTLLLSRVLLSTPSISPTEHAAIARCSRAIAAIGQAAINLGDPKLRGPIVTPRTAGACTFAGREHEYSYDFTAPIDATLFDTLLSGNDPDKVRP